MSFRSLTRTYANQVANVILARPDSHNALNVALIEELTRCFEEISDDESVRVVVLAGEGRSFCAGADIGYMRETAAFSYEENLEDARRLAMMFWTIDECPKPVIAKVHGAAMGGGAGLVAVADVAVVDAEAKFAFSEVRLGIAPATIAPFVVRKIGASHARSLFLTGERFGADRAREIGLAHEVASGDELDAAVEASVKSLLSGGPVAQATIKALLRRLETTEPMEAPGLTSRVISELRTGEEGQEGLAAFLEKREPRWRVE
ncbi:MAG TPA: enoyl-CoA hydratase-related protein [Rubrobacter sp.]|nr:enoyl-CoA hydratase-related protein [Rubrobacter sp.]